MTDLPKPHYFQLDGLQFEVAGTADKASAMRFAREAFGMANNADFGRGLLHGSDLTSTDFPRVEVSVKPFDEMWHSKLALTNRGLSNEMLEYGSKDGKFVAQSHLYAHSGVTERHTVAIGAKAPPALNEATGRKSSTSALDETNLNIDDSNFTVADGRGLQMDSTLKGILSRASDDSMVRTGGRQQFTERMSGLSTARAGVLNRICDATGGQAFADALASVGEGE